ncbi:MAG: hypothetical protein K8R48_06530 [Alphaproteobacteria bacterium]|nr:hypothetical protein [Alphaproteobacteria bacterium]
MDKNLLEKFLKLLGSDQVSDSLMGLYGVQDLFKAEGASLDNALRYAADNLDKLGQGAGKTIDLQAAEKSAAPAVAKPAAPPVVNISGVPECRMLRAGILEIVQPGKADGDAYQLPGTSAQDAESIALGLKDAIVAAVINKSRFKLKLLDIKTGKGDILETILQAEYERVGMTPVRVWVGSRGDVGALAAVLRKAVATSMPELAGA